jgi:hypothetical protein
MNNSSQLLRDMVAQIGKLQTAGFENISFILIGQCIELMGAITDRKPLRARQQSRERFALALHLYFPAAYEKINQQGWFYDKLRNHMTHTFAASSWLLLTNQPDPVNGRSHLGYQDKRLILVAELFYQDLKVASAKILDLLENGTLKEKSFEIR